MKANLSSQSRELFDTNNEIEGENDSKTGSILEEEEVKVDMNREGLENQSLWSQIKEIVLFTGPATGLWLCGPLMSLIDTVVIGQGSYIELAALGPATVLCDYMSYVFMFLSIATSNMVATYLARRDKNQVQHQISILLFVGMTCGLLMLLFTRFFGSWALTAFSGPKKCTNSTCSKYIRSDSRLSMACSSCRMGCSKCKSWHERFVGASEGFGGF